MVLQPFRPEAGLFEDMIRSHQYGHGALGRYRGSDMQNGSGIGSFLRSLFSRFAMPLVRSAMPHMKTALEAAKPHLSNAAHTVVGEVSKGVANKINEVLAAQPAQEGTGRRKRLAITKKAPSANKRKRNGSVRYLKRIPPFDLPDSF